MFCVYLWIIRYTALSIQVHTHVCNDALLNCSIYQQKVRTYGMEEQNRMRGLDPKVNILSRFMEIFLVSFMLPYCLGDIIQLLDLHSFEMLFFKV